MSVPNINKGSRYYAGSEITDQIAQLQLTSAVANFSQTTNAICRYVETGTIPFPPSSDGNLINNSTVLLDDSGNITDCNSISLVPTDSDPIGNSLWLNGYNNHLYHGTTDIEAGVTFPYIYDPINGNLMVGSSNGMGNVPNQTNIVYGLYCGNDNFKGSSNVAIGYNIFTAVDNTLTSPAYENVAIGM